MTAKPKHARLLICLTVLAQAACASRSGMQAPLLAAQELVLWRIEQRGYGPLASFELCEPPSCATPSKKSVAIRTPPNARTSEAGRVGAGLGTDASTPNASSARTPGAVPERPP
jgi:hypothetical protein